MGLFVGHLLTPEKSHQGPSDGALEFDPALFERWITFDEIPSNVTHLSKNFPGSRLPKWN